MSKRKYIKRADPTLNNSHSPSCLPTDRPVAVYYRQSSDAQVGNISTAMQTIDLPDYLKRLGWAEDKIILIDNDAGISGTTKIDERPGMRRLFDFIIDGSIGAVACQDEDRLFRDLTQIQVNIFIQACLEGNVQVLTPSVTYDFAHATMGAFHARQFRFKSEMSAEYITSYIRGRLQPARARLINDGMWAGASVPPGYIIDIRKVLPDGSRNPNWRKYTPFEPFVDVVNQYFQLFLSKCGNLKQTGDHVRLHGPYYPDWDDLETQKSVPEGFKLIKPYNIKRGERGYCPDASALGRMFTNAVYLGHWVTRSQVIKRKNHPAIVPEEVFMRAFNYLAEFRFDGTPNPDYRPRKRNARPTVDVRRNEPRPLCEGLIYSCDDEVWRPAGVHWNQQTGRYAYAFLSREVNNPVIWYKQAFYVDEVVVMHLQSLLLTTFKPETWDALVASFGDDHEKERKRTVKQLASLEKDIERLINNLAKLTNDQMIDKAQAHYEQYELERSRLQIKLADLDLEIAQRQSLLKLRDTYSPAVNNWKNLTLDEQRLVVHVFLERIEITPLPAKAIRVLIKWRDGSSDRVDIPRKGTTYTQWLASESNRLIDLLELGATQLEIAAAFPKRTWSMIRNKILSFKGRFPKTIAPKPIKDRETYNDYLKRLERIRLTGGPKRNDIRDKWQPREVELLNRMLDESATQLELVKAFPRRNWDGVRRKITVERGKQFKVAGTGEVERYESYTQYCFRKEQELNQTDANGSSERMKISSYRWQPDELEKLRRLLDNGAEQLELLKTLPTRNWDGIRRKINTERGKEFHVYLTPGVLRYETFAEYCQRQGWEAETAGEKSLTNTSSDNCSDKAHPDGTCLTRRGGECYRHRSSLLH